jgi:hypothetical protein
LFRFLGYLLSSIATLSVGSILLNLQKVPNKSEYVRDLDMPSWLDVPVPAAPDRAEVNLTGSTTQVSHIDELGRLSVQSASLPSYTVAPMQSVEDSSTVEVQVARAPEIQLQDRDDVGAPGDHIGEKPNEESPSSSSNTNILRGEDNRSLANQRAPLLSPPKVRSELPRLSSREATQIGPISRIAKQTDSSSDSTQPIARGPGPAMQQRHPSGLLIRPKSTFVSLPTSEEVARARLSRTRSVAAPAERRYSSIELPPVLRPTPELPQILRPTRP